MECLISFEDVLYWDEKEVMVLKYALERGWTDGADWDHWFQRFHDYLAGGPEHPNDDFDEYEEIGARLDFGTTDAIRWMNNNNPNSHLVYFIHDDGFFIGTQEEMDSMEGAL